MKGEGLLLSWLERKRGGKRVEKGSRSCALKRPDKKGRKENNNQNSDLTKQGEIFVVSYESGAKRNWLTGKTTTKRIDKKIIFHGRILM